MQLASERELKELSQVLRNPSSQGPDPCYWVFKGIGHEKWENLTVIAPGDFDGEFNKTFGHYHPDEVNEVYKLIGGEGLLVLQKKVEIEEEIGEFIVIRTGVSDEIIITPEYGHAWINIGDTPLVSLDTWRQGHTPQDYETIKKLKGLAYYILKAENGNYKLVQNSHYKNHPPALFLTTSEFLQMKSH